MSSEMKEENSSTSSDVKNEENSDEQKKIDNETKDDDKDSEKSDTKEDSGKEASDDEDEESSDEEVALLDRPVEVTGCRARKQVERLEISFTTPKEKQEVPEGKGKKLGDCPRIELQIGKMKPVDLKPLHKILFNRTGSVHEIKKNIRKFSGFPFEKDSSEFARKKLSVEKSKMSILKEICLILDIERGGTKDEITNRIMSFLMNPEDSGRKVPAPKKKASKDKKKSSAKKGKSEKKGKPTKDDSDDEADAIREEDDSTGGEASMGGTDEEAEALLTESKKKSKESKKPKPKAEKRKKEVKKQKGKKRKHDDDKSSGSSSDEPAAKRSKMPSDEEISKLVKKILQSADLQEITMKKVIKQVSDTYPDFDLSHKKAFIKSTIKAIL